MTTQEFIEYMNSGKTVTAGSPVHGVMHRLSQEAIRITMELNTKYHTHEEVVRLMSELTDKQIDDSFGLFPPFNTDCGKNLTIGKRVFINSGCEISRPRRNNNRRRCAYWSQCGDCHAQSFI